MNTKDCINEKVNRITVMETYLNTLLNAVESRPESVFENNELHEMLIKLTEYYESPLWMEDYESDERGELPKELKRGVLSEDGVYLLIESITEYIKASGNI
ncbi:MAG: DUF4298 domain-containing protein [Ruminococcaceae bacterium]|nr:DUF4298 domain-containing protein [Oscillospiraceae bacterium]